LNGLNEFLVSAIRSKIGITAYLSREAPLDDVQKLRDEISAISGVKSVEYTSQEEAFKKFIEKHKNNSVIMKTLDIVGEDSLPASLTIRAATASEYESVANFLKRDSLKGLIDEFNYSEEEVIIERLFSITSNVKNAVLIFGLCLIFVVFLITFNTIKIAIYNAKEEISVMKLVGASNFFVRGPFIVQGILCGVAAAFFSLIFFFTLSYFLTPKFLALTSDVSSGGFNLLEYFKNNFLIIAAIQFITGIGLGVISSALAVRKYLIV